MVKEHAKELALVFVVSLWASFAPVHFLVKVVSALVAVDLLTGVHAAVRTGGFKAIISNRIRHTFGKLLGYYILLGVGLGLDTATGGDGLLVSRAVAVTIALAEAVSIDENVRPYTGVSILGVLDGLKERLKPPPKT